MGVIVLALRDGSICHPFNPLRLLLVLLRLLSPGSKSERGDGSPWSRQAETQARTCVDNAAIRHTAVEGPKLDAAGRKRY